MFQGEHGSEMWEDDELILAFAYHGSWMPDTLSELCGLFLR